MKARRKVKTSAGCHTLLALTIVVFFAPIRVLAIEGPKVNFDNTTFNFGKVPAGVIIQHAFAFTNAGDQLLEIKDVRPSCGCTTAGAWVHEIQPGTTGTIPVRFNSTEYTGPIHKTVIVISNDPAQTNLILHLQGTIWRPIEVTPDYATFLASSDVRTNQIKLVRIVSNLEQPLTLSAPECTNSAFQFTLKTVQAGKEFELAIALTPQPKAVSLAAPVILRTSSTNQPLVTVMARAIVQPPVTAMPTNITLPGRQLSDRLEFPVVIRNNSAAPLILSEPSVVTGVWSSETPGDVTMAPLGGAEARVKEVQPGRMFILAASFPAGFHLAPTQSVELRVKTNHPSFPLFRIPVVQGRSMEAALEESDSQQPAQLGTASALRR